MTCLHDKLPSLKPMLARLMLARHYQTTDAEAVEHLLNGRGTGDVRLDRDRLVVVGRPPRGLLVWRPGCLVHELHTGYGMAQRHTADVLVNFGMADAVSKPFDLYEAVFITDSDAVGEYVKSLGALEEVGKKVWTMRIRP
jgi:hypothetical protein